jgi:hypothetical protein
VFVSCLFETAVGSLVFSPNHKLRDELQLVIRLLPGPAWSRFCRSTSHLWRGFFSQYLSAQARWRGRTPGPSQVAQPTSQDKAGKCYWRSSSLFSNQSWPWTQWAIKAYLLCFPRKISFSPKKRKMVRCFCLPLFRALNTLYTWCQEMQTPSCEYSTDMGDMLKGAELVDGEGLGTSPCPPTMKLLFYSEITYLCRLYYGWEKLLFYSTFSHVFMLKAQNILYPSG